MKSKINAENMLADKVQRNGWQRKKLLFQTISSEDLASFPELMEKDLRIVFTGSYQLKQAISYLSEMIDESGNVSIQYVKGCSNILKAEVPSRHISKKIYRCLIEYNRNVIAHKNC